MTDTVREFTGIEAQALRFVTGWAGLDGSTFLGAEQMGSALRTWFTPSAEQSLRDLAAREEACCGVLAFDVTSADGRVQVDITSPILDIPTLMRVFPMPGAGGGAGDV